jgi:hypothetical protein
MIVTISSMTDGCAALKDLLLMGYPGDAERRY